MNEAKDKSIDVESAGIKSSFGDYLFLLGGKFVLIPLQFLSIAIITRTIGEEGFGKFSLFRLVAQIVFLFAINWTAAAIIRYGREEFVHERKINKVFWGRNALVVPCISISFIAIFFLRNWIADYIGMPQSWIWILLAYILGLFLINYVQYLQQAVGQMKLFALFQAVQQLVIVGGLLLIYGRIFSQGLINILLVFTASSFLIIPFAVRFFDPATFLPITFSKETIRRVATFSYPIIFGSASAYIVNWIDLIVIKKYMTIADVGTYALAYQGMAAVQQITMATITLMGPIIVAFVAQNREDLIIKYARRIVPQGILVWSMFQCAVIFSSLYLIPLIFGVDFNESVLPFTILMVGLGFTALAAFYSPILTAYELIKQAMAVNVIMALLNLLGDFLLVPMIGIKGAAIATAFSFFFGAFMYWVISNQRLKLREWNQVALAFIPFLYTMIVFLFENLWFRVVGLILIVIASIVLAKRWEVFRKSDLDFLDRVDIPEAFRAGLYKVYSWMSK